MQLLQGQAVSASWSTLQKSDPCCCFCKLIEVSSVYGGPGSAKTVDLPSPLIHWPEYGDRSPTGMRALPHLSFPCCCLTGRLKGWYFWITSLDTGFKCCHASNKCDCMLLLLTYFSILRLHSSALYHRLYCSDEYHVTMLRALQRLVWCKTLGKDRILPTSSHPTPLAAAQNKNFSVFFHTCNKNVRLYDGFPEKLLHPRQCQYGAHTLASSIDKTTDPDLHVLYT